MEYEAKRVMMIIVFHILSTSMYVYICLSLTMYVYICLSLTLFLGGRGGWGQGMGGDRMADSTAQGSLWQVSQSVSHLSSRRPFVLSFFLSLCFYLKRPDVYWLFTETHTSPTYLQQRPLPAPGAILKGRKK